MKKILLFITSAVSAASCFAQPVLMAADVTPTAGEAFYRAYADESGVSAGTSGPAVTWNYATLSEVFRDTVLYVSCASTLYCDSFPGSDLVLVEGDNNSYMTTGADGLKIIGQQFATDFAHYDDSRYVFYTPLSYLSGHNDTFSASYTDSSYYESLTGTDSFTYDGYGTLILPVGTFTDVIRIHTTNTTKDSTNDAGMADVYESRTESYNWYQAGFHNPLLTITTDTSAGTTFVTSVVYYGRVLTTTGLAGRQSVLLDVYPNPANDNIHARFTVNGHQHAQITLMDIAGRAVAVVKGSEIKSGVNDIAIPVSGLSNGLYMLRLDANGTSVTRKVSVSK